MTPDQQRASDEARSTPTSSSSTLSPVVIRRIVIAVVALVVVSTLVPIVLTVGALFLQYKLGGFSLGSIVQEPYYSDVVNQIERDPGFRNALGTPIAIDDGKISCGYVSDDSVQKKANCTIPVHGPKGAGSVRVQIVDTANNLDLGAWLTIGDRTIPIGS